MTMVERVTVLVGSLIFGAFYLYLCLLTSPSPYP
jgi:hypothetical protein